jgi:hypothetical protein
MMKITQFIYPALLLIFFSLLTLLADPASLRESIPALFMVLIIVMVPYNIIRAGPPIQIPNEVSHLAFLAASCILFTSLFWFHASLGSYGFETGMGLSIGKRLFFWLPAVVLTCFYRMPGEFWYPNGRKKFMIRLLIAVASGLTGLLLQEIVQINM